MTDQTNTTQDTEAPAYYAVYMGDTKGKKGISHVFYRVSDETGDSLPETATVYDGPAEWFVKNVLGVQVGTVVKLTETRREGTQASYQFSRIGPMKDSRKAAIIQARHRASVQARNQKAKEVQLGKNAALADTLDALAVAASQMTANERTALAAYVLTRILKGR